MHVFISLNGADGAHHDAGPAADAFFQVDCDVSRFFIFANPAGNASQNASRFLTAPALDRDRPNTMKRSFLINRFNMDSWTMK